MRTGTANLPLHGGAAPRWLFQRMTALAREIARLIVEAYGPHDLLLRLADPFWFQSLGCVLGFDWHSSGVTTTTCGALKEGLKGLEGELGVFVCGGKGATSRKTPQMIEDHAARHSIARDPAELVYASRISAKVDSAAVQDGYQLYHHTFVFTRAGDWSVVQQGMSDANRCARRYHWISEGLESYVNEPHSAICAQNREPQVLNMVARDSEQSRRTTALLSRERPQAIAREIEKMQSLTLPRRHQLLVRDLRPASVERILLKTYERPPGDFEALLGASGVGAKTIRALALVAELVHGVEASWRDPAQFAFAHGGKDGHPFPVDRPTYDHSIEVLREAVNRARIGDRDRMEALRRLARFQTPRRSS